MNSENYFSNLPLETQKKILDKTNQYPHLARNLTNRLRESSIRDFYLQSCLKVPLSDKELSNSLILEKIPTIISGLGVQSISAVLSGTVFNYRFIAIIIQKFNDDESIDCLYVDWNSIDNNLYKASPKKIILRNIDAIYDIINIKFQLDFYDFILYNYNIIYSSSSYRITCLEYNHEYPFEFTNNYIESTIEYLLSKTQDLRSLTMFLLSNMPPETYQNQTYFQELFNIINLYINMRQSPQRDLNIHYINNELLIYLSDLTKFSSFRRYIRPLDKTTINQLGIGLIDRLNLYIKSLRSLTIL